MVLPARIPARDSALLRYWINNVTQLEDGNTGFDLFVVDQDNLPIADEEIILVGNGNMPGQAEIKETFIVKTAENGRVSLNFGAGSVVSRFWYVGPAGKSGAEYEEIKIEPGRGKKITLSWADTR